jgi:hypothetical protein
MQDRTSANSIKVLLQRTAGPYMWVIRVTSVRSRRSGMSAMPPIATEAVPRKEASRCANRVLMQRNNDFAIR